MGGGGSGGPLINPLGPALRRQVVPVSEHNPVAFDLRPRMMVSEGCSGSSYALEVIKEMMEAHESSPIEYRYNGEMMKCWKNPECTGSGWRGGGLKKGLHSV